MIRNPPDVEGIVQLENLWMLPGIRHGFATRWGHLENVVPPSIARLKQVHGANVLILPQQLEDRFQFMETNKNLWPHADGLITNCPEVTVAVAVAEVNRYTRQPIELRDERISSIRVSGAFDAGDIDGFVAALQDLYPLEARRAPDGHLILTAPG